MEWVWGSWLSIGMASVRYWHGTGIDMLLARYWYGIGIVSVC